MRVSPLVVVAALPACVQTGKPALFVNPGPMITPTTSPTHATGFGGEISTVYYGEHPPVGHGPLVQGEWIPGDDARRGAGRVAGEWQAVVGSLGVDGGWAYRSDGGPDAPWATGIQLGAFFSIANASIGVRGMMPVARGGSKDVGAGDFSTVITLKVPLLVYGEMPDFDPFRDMFRMPSGRPLIVASRARVASLVRTSSWLG